MDNYRSSDVLNRMTDVRVPSGMEVESAALLPPVTGETRTVATRGGWMAKVDSWKSRGSDLVRHMSHTMSERTHTLATNVSTRTADMKRMMMERSARVKPMIHDTMDKA